MSDEKQRKIYILNMDKQSESSGKMSFFQTSYKSLNNMQVNKSNNQEAVNTKKADQ